MPETSAPSWVSHSASQLPLNPVWPVTRTRRPRYTFLKQVIPRFSTELFRSATAPRDDFCHAACPWPARNLNVGTPVIDYPGIVEPMARFPTRSHLRLCSSEPLAPVQRNHR